MAKQTPQEKRKQELIDELVKDYDGPESFWGESGIFADLKKRIVDRDQGKWKFTDSRLKIVSNFTPQFEKILKTANVKKGQFHDLRRTAITDLVDRARLASANCVDEKLLQICCSSDFFEADKKS